jgi:peptidylprolyl isomerase
MSLKKGDFVTYDLTAKIKETSKVFDTTIEEVATKAKLKNQGDKYEPRLVVLGENWVLKAVDDALLTLEVDKPLTVEIPPEKAFGARSNDLVKTVLLRSLLEKGIKPVMGAQLQAGGKTILVRSVSGGRVVLDYNHVLAGKTLVYELTLKSVLSTPEERIKALLHRRMPTIDITKFKMDYVPYVKDSLPESVTFYMPDETLNTEGIQQIKRGLAQEIQKFFPDVEKVFYVEAFINPAKVPKVEPIKVEPLKKIGEAPTISDTKKV